MRTAQGPCVSAGVCFLLGSRDLAAYALCSLGAFERPCLSVPVPVPACSLSRLASFFFLVSPLYTTTSLVL